MPRYLLHRIAQAAFTLFCVLTFAFVLGRATGKPAGLLLPDNATADEVDALNGALGFNEPLHVQFGTFLANVLAGDFGQSYRQREPALDLVIERLPATFELAFWSFLLGLVLALAAALAIQLTGSRTLRSLFIWGGSLRQSVPDFFFALLAVLVFSVALGLLPSLGRMSPASLVLPVLTIATGQFVLYVRLMDAALSDQASQDYVRTAFAKGQSRARVLVSHMLPNALLPVLTMAGLNLGSLLGGTVVVEAVFAWPGLGQVLTDAVSQRDFPIVQAGLLVVALIFVTVNLAVDLLSAKVDPRVSLA
ncbi:ABC transporter permease [Arthrobacter sp. G.S.26]|uniref:ABC transporter permease n=1 Tax=Arthrobacter sp. G.S.26 TaxID=3433706 RepID=UPI003D776D9F